MKTFTSAPLGPVTSAIEVDTLADWLGGVDVADPLLPIMAITATAMVIEYLERELISRDRRTVFEMWPYSGTDTDRGLSPNEATLDAIVEVPYGKVGTLTTVEAGGDAVDVDSYRLLDGFPSRIMFDTIPGFTNDDAPALSLTYTSGFGADPADVPQEIRGGVLMVADFLYNNRGSCSAADAVNKSGVASILGPYRARAILL